MELIDVIARVSVLYRREMAKKTDTKAKIDAINKEFRAAVEKNWETMSVARRNELDYQRRDLEHEAKEHALRAEGMYEVREMLMDLLESEGKGD